MNKANPVDIQCTCSGMCIEVFVCLFKSGKLRKYLFNSKHTMKMHINVTQYRCFHIHNDSAVPNYIKCMYLTDSIKIKNVALPQRTVFSADDNEQGFDLLFLADSTQG